MKANDLRAQALQKHAEATGIVEAAVNGLSAEDDVKVGKMMDDVQSLIEQAERIERLEAQGKKFGTPAQNPLNFSAMNDGNPADEAKDIEAALRADDRAFVINSKTYAAAQRKYLLRGQQMLTQDEAKLLSVGVAPAGGYLESVTVYNEMLENQRDILTMRQICRVMPPIPSGWSIAPTSSPLSDAEWTSELSTGNDDVVQPFGGRVLLPHPLAKRVKVSNSLMRNPTFNIERWLLDEMAVRFSVAEENAYINGTGTRQALGLLNSGIQSFTTAASNTLTPEDVVNFVYTLKAFYASRASTRLLCNRSFVRKVRLMCTNEGGAGTGDFLWQPSMAGGTPSTILDMPYVVSDKFPTGLDAGDAWEDDAAVAVVGDFSYYWIADAMDFSVQRLNELYAEQNMTGYIGRKETDGMPMLAEAFVKLVIKA